MPAEVARDTLSDINRWFGGQEDSPPRPPWGITSEAVSWLVHHLTGELYRLGRLQFQFGRFGYELRAFRNRNSGTVIALCEDGISYREDGGRVSEGVETGPGAWTFCLVLTEHHVTGNPISPEGRALREEVTLPAVEWKQVLAPKQAVLHLHIPAGGPLHHDECGHSLRRARDFFTSHFPDRPFSAFCCRSWLLDAELQHFLPDTANIVRFQREFYLFPVRSTPEYLVQHILGQVPDDLSAAPRRTGLQRALLDMLNRGEVLRPTGGACFLLPEDLDWGSQVYLRRRVA